MSKWVALRDANRRALTESLATLTEARHALWESRLIRGLDLWAASTSPSPCLVEIPHVDIRSMDWQAFLDMFVAKHSDRECCIKIIHQQNKQKMDPETKQLINVAVITLKSERRLL